MKYTFDWLSMLLIPRIHPQLVIFHGKKCVKTSLAYHSNSSREKTGCFMFHLLIRSGWIKAIKKSCPSGYGLEWLGELYSDRYMPITRGFHTCAGVLCHWREINPNSASYFHQHHNALRDRPENCGWKYQLQINVKFLLGWSRVSVTVRDPNWPPKKRENKKDKFKRDIFASNSPQSPASPNTARSPVTREPSPAWPATYERRHEPPIAINKAVWPYSRPILPENVRERERARGSSEPGVLSTGRGGNTQNRTTTTTTALQLQGNTTKTVTVDQARDNWHTLT